ncbi:MAG: hypothetical protein RQ839_00600 [Thermoproteus sp.]|jgi:hypothetical protein|uniref:hypothetical protein n=1 Tax=Thermoproteus sp. CP80 TaxID=1650659 RepID=UPI0009C129A0|nr:hypothetical protein [Thermoproteus sp. CP80]MDT7868666.1 hypothetical protein [Thermoproteus sp.]MDT7881121.1 hypothetical protein [Thermoproteus sp.]PLC65915.1 hypothetical protein B7L68_02375 [Thermoproteus sp. CP80]
MARALGYGLLAAGVVLIAAAVFMVYAALAGYVEPFHIFSFSDVVASYGSVQVKVVEGSQLSKMADLSFWALLAAFVASAGGKLADLGVKLIASER